MIDENIYKKKILSKFVKQLAFNKTYSNCALK